MTESELKHLEDLCAKALKPGWHHALDDLNDADLNFYTAARDALPKLIAEIRGLRAK